MRNKAIDTLRKRKSHQRLVEAEVREREAGDAIEHGQSDLDGEITRGQLLQMLTPPFRQAIVLTKIIGCSNAEAARQLQISETAVKVRVHRGIARLRTLLEADDQ